MPRPNRTGQLIPCELVMFSTRAGCQVTPPVLPPPPGGRTDGAGFIHQSTNPGCGPHANQGARAPVGTLRAGPGLGWRSAGRVDAVRSRARGIEAIFRSACGHGYSRNAVQRILGRYADD